MIYLVIIKHFLAKKKNFFTVINITWHVNNVKIKKL